MFEKLCEYASALTTRNSAPSACVITQVHMYMIVVWRMISNTQLCNQLNDILSYAKAINEICFAFQI